MLKLELVKNKSQLKQEQQNHYEVIELIGCGTFGKVFLMRQKKSKNIFAVKSVLQDRRYKNRELSIISRLKNDNIIEMLDFYMKVKKNENYLYIVMEYIPDSLSQLIKNQRPLKKPFSSIFRKIVIFQLFKALYYLELTHVCHRDLKPPNILINKDTFQLKLCDFGSAKIIQNNEKNVSYICSRYYRAPQLLLGKKKYGTEIDIWSAGCIIVQLLTCEPIFPGDSSMQQLIEIIKVLGTPPKEVLSIYEEQTGKKLLLPFIKANNWNNILKKYTPEPELVKLISSILTYNIQQRLTPLQILKLPYFHNLLTCHEQIAKLPHLLSFQTLCNGHNKMEIASLRQLYEYKINEDFQCKQIETDQSPIEPASHTPNDIDVN